MRSPIGSEFSRTTSDTRAKWFRKLLGYEEFHTHVRWWALRPMVDRNAAITVEVGAGVGIISFAVARMVSGKLIASELESDRLERAKLVAHLNSIKNVEFVQANASQLEGVLADQLLMIDVLEHIDDDQGVLRSLHSIVRERGQFIISVPTPKFPEYFGRDYHESLGHVRDGYTLESLTRVLADAGFEMEDHRFHTGVGARLVAKLVYRNGISAKWNMALFPLFLLLCRVTEPFTRASTAGGLTVRATPAPSMRRQA